MNADERESIVYCAFLRSIESEEDVQDLMAVERGLIEIRMGKTIPLEQVMAELGFSEE